MGIALKALDREAEATGYLERAARGLAEPTSAMFYNDQPPEMIYYQGLALRELGREAQARDRFERLIAYGREHLSETPEIDYFAVSLPEFLVFEPDLTARNETHCRLMIALGYMGLGRCAEAKSEVDAILGTDPAHLLASRLLIEIESESSGASATKPSASVDFKAPAGAVSAARR
jgi:tetratricopeptide (TPR) repeat protein